VDKRLYDRLTTNWGEGGERLSRNRMKEEDSDAGERERKRKTTYLRGERQEKRPNSGKRRRL